MLNHDIGPFKCVYHFHILFCFNFDCICAWVTVKSSIQCYWLCACRPQLFYFLPFAYHSFDASQFHVNNFLMMSSGFTSLLIFLENSANILSKNIHFIILIVASTLFLFPPFYFAISWARNSRLKIIFDIELMFICRVFQTDGLRLTRRNFPLFFKGSWHTVFVNYS